MHKHVTKEGREISLCEMENSHLTNYINMVLNTAEVCKNVINSGPGTETITELLHGVSRKQQIHSAKAKIKEIYQLLPHYIMEASIRGIDFGARLREVFEREKKSVKINLPLDFRIEFLLEG